MDDYDMDGRYRLSPHPDEHEQRMQQLRDRMEERADLDVRRRRRLQAEFPGCYAACPACRGGDPGCTWCLSTGRVTHAGVRQFGRDVSGSPDE